MMKTILAAAALIAITTAPAAAFERQVPISRHLYTCANTALSRVAFRPTPASCCDGIAGCPQLLANTGMVKPKRPNRT